MDGCGRTARVILTSTTAPARHGCTSNPATRNQGSTTTERRSGLMEWPRRALTIQCNRTIMQSMKLMLLYLLPPFTLFLSLWSSPPVPYSGKIDIRGVNYFGEGQFAFSLHDGNGTTHWRNGSQAGETIKVSIHNGRYSVLLGGPGNEHITTGVISEPR